MGSRGAGSGREVAYDKWGHFIEPMEGFGNRKAIYDENGNEVGSEHLEDSTHQVYVPVIQEATVSQIVKDINAWKNDDGTYGDEDTYMSVEYSDGRHISNQDDNFRKVFAKNKRDIVGATISTADYEAAAGKTKTSKGWVDNETSEAANGKSYTNSYIGYVSVGEYKTRNKYTYLEGSYAKAHGKRTTTIEKVRQSKVKPREVPKKINNGYGKIKLVDRDHPL